MPVNDGGVPVTDTDDHPAGWVLCLHCGMWVDPSWRPCARDPQIPCVMIDIDERNADLARERIGMFLEVNDPRDMELSP